MRRGLRQPFLNLLCCALLLEITLGQLSGRSGACYTGVDLASKDPGPAPDIAEGAACQEYCQRQTAEGSGCTHFSYDPTTKDCWSLSAGNEQVQYVAAHEGVISGDVQCDLSALKPYRPPATPMLRATEAPSNESKEPAGPGPILIGSAVGGGLAVVLGTGAAIYATRVKATPHMLIDSYWERDDKPDQAKQPPRPKAAKPKPPKPALPT